jgi:hypothetical protein
MRNIAVGVVGVLILASGVLSVSARAQDETKTTHKNVRTLTGCLQKTDDEKEYKLTTDSGGTWEIKSDSVNLSDHVGHTVSVTGAVSHPAMHGAKEDAKDEAKEHGMDKGAAEHGHLTVTAIKMVSKSCKM